MLAIDVSLSMQADDVAADPHRGGPGRGQGVRRRAAGRRSTWAWSPSPSRPTCWSRRPRTATRCSRRSTACSWPRRPRPARRSSPAWTRSARSRPTAPQGPPPARIVLLSDGYRTVRPVDRGRRRRRRRRRNVPVSTIAFGTDDGRGRHRRQLQRVPVDRPSLQQLAETTKGYFYEAASGRASSSRCTRTWAARSATGPSRARSPSGIVGRRAAAGARRAAGLSLLWTSRLP